MPEISGNVGTRSAVLLDRLEGARKLEERRRAVQQSADLQRLTADFQKDLQCHEGLTKEDLKRLHEISRLAKSIATKMED
jgi:hypothetical protein